jgi:hypothetical protein
MFNTLEIHDKILCPLGSSLSHRNQLCYPENRLSVHYADDTWIYHVRSGYLVEDECEQELARISISERTWQGLI